MSFNIIMSSNTGKTYTITYNQLTNFNDVDYDQFCRDIDKMIMEIEEPPKTFTPTVRWRLVGKAVEKASDIKKDDYITCITETFRNEKGQRETVITDIAKVNYTFADLKCQLK